MKTELGKPTFRPVVIHLQHAGEIMCVKDLITVGLDHGPWTAEAKIVGAKILEACNTSLDGDEL